MEPDAHGVASVECARGEEPGAFCFSGVVVIVQWNGAVERWNRLPGVSISANGLPYPPPSRHAITCLGSGSHAREYIFIIQFNRLILYLGALFS